MRLTGVLMDFCFDERSGIDEDIYPPKRQYASAADLDKPIIAGVPARHPMARGDSRPVTAVLFSWDRFFSEITRMAARSRPCVIGNKKSTVF
jgi:hypothetical protein